MNEIINFPIDSNERAENIIASTNSIESLIDALYELKRITGADGYVYTADELVSTIEKIAQGELSPKNLTRTSGLRDKVVSLLPAYDGGLTEKHDNFSSIYDNAHHNTAIKVLLGTYYASENTNFPQRQNNYIFFTKEQLKDFVSSVTTTEQFNKYISQLLYSLERELADTEESFRKAEIKHSISQIENLTSDEIEDAISILYS